MRKVILLLGLVLQVIIVDAQVSIRPRACFSPSYNRHYKIFCVNGNTGFRNESRIFYFIHLQNEEAYERKESSSA